MAPLALIIVTGHPATGKTTLSHSIAADLRLPLISKDLIKETIFDTLGWSDREWSRRVGASAMALLFKLADTLLQGNTSLILESNFRRDLDTAHMRELQRRHGCAFIQVRCVASDEVMFERLRARALPGVRHPGHGEALAPADPAQMTHLGRAEPLALAGPLLTVDTTDLAQVRVDEVLAWLRSSLAAAGVAAGVAS
jgi:predicted kinase